MTNTLNDYKIYTYNSKVISDFVLHKRLTDLNYVTFTSPVYIESGSSITLKYLDIDDVFIGKVTQCRKIARSVTDIAQFDIEAVELAEELTNIYITDTNYTGLYINNTSNNKRLFEYVDYILPFTWSDISDSTYKYKTIVSGGASSDYIPSMGFSTCTVWTALQRLIVTIFNYGMWFEYPAGKKCIRYGEYNRDVYNYDYPTPINITMQENSVDHNVDGVIVYGADNSLYKTYGNVSAGSRTVAYRYSGCNSLSELQWVARKLYDDRKEPQIRYEIEFPAGYYKINEGDRIHIYDTSIGLLESETGYGVKDVQVRDDKTIVGIGSASLTVFDILNDRLSKIDGGILSYTATPIETDYNNVAASAGTSDLYGEEVGVDFEITGDTFLGDLYLAPEFSGLRQEGEGYFTIYSAVGSMIDASIPVTADMDIIFGASGTVLDHYPVLSESWFPWTWEWVEILVEYVFDRTTPVDAGVIWSCDWPNINILGADCTKYSSSNQTTITHRWFVPQMEAVEYSYPTINVAATNDDVLLSSINITMNIYYNESEVYHPSTTLETGDAQMKMQYLDEDTSTYVDMCTWFTIYDAADPDTYIGATYDMANYIAYSAVEPGTHRFVYRCKGQHPEATIDGIAIKMNGSYASFDEKTRIV